MRRKLRVWLLIAAGLAAQGAFAQQAPDAGYQRSFEKWKSDLVQDRKENWIPLAGLFWLKPGQNTFGSDAGNAMVFPRGAPAWAGEFDLWDGQVRVKLSPGIRATIAGKSVVGEPFRGKMVRGRLPGGKADVGGILLQPDTSGQPTVIDLGSLRLHVIVRGVHIGIRVKDLESAAARKYEGASFYPINMAYRVTAKFVPAAKKQTVMVPDVIGVVTPTPLTGEVVFSLGGKEYRLSDLGGDASKGLFFAFSDLTNKTATYPAGRFLHTGPVVNGAVVLDFNRAYNPPCSVTRFATCPLPPRENRLAVAIPAGEMYERGQRHR
jgi:uncharacterized protein